MPSFTLSAADVQAIKDAFAVVLNKLPFLISLTADDRKSILKTGSDSLTFVSKAFTAQANPTIFPASFKTDAFQRDVDLFSTLTELSSLADQVAAQIDDTRMAVGGEAMQQAIQTYEYVKTAAKTTPGLRPVAEELGERFKKSGGSTPPAKPTPRAAAPRAGHHAAYGD